MEIRWGTREKREGESERNTYSGEGDYSGIKEDRRENRKAKKYNASWAKCGGMKLRGQGKNTMRGKGTLPQ